MIAYVDDLLVLIKTALERLGELIVDLVLEWFIRTELHIQLSKTETKIMMLKAKLLTSDPIMRLHGDPMIRYLTCFMPYIYHTYAI